MHLSLSTVITVTVSSKVCLKKKKQLQVIQNADAHVHWLPVAQIIDFKLLLLIYKSIHGLASEYINNLILRYKPSKSLRSCSSNLLIRKDEGPRCRTRAQR